MSILLRVKNDTLRDLVADFLINSILSYCCHCEEADYVKDEQILEFFEQFGSTFSKIIMHEQTAYHSHQLQQYFLVLNAVAKSSLLARYALNTSTQLTSKIIQCILQIAHRIQEVKLAIEIRALKSTEMKLIYQLYLNF